MAYLVSHREHDEHHLPHISALAPSQARIYIICPCGLCLSQAFNPVIFISSPNVRIHGFCSMLSPLLVLVPRDGGSSASSSSQPPWLLQAINKAVHLTPSPGRPEAHGICFLLPRRPTMQYYHASASRGVHFRVAPPSWS